MTLIITIDVHKVNKDFKASRRSNIQTPQIVGVERKQNSFCFPRRRPIYHVRTKFEHRLLAKSFYALSVTKVLLKA